MFATYQDAIEQLVDYLGGNPSDQVQRDCRRAVLEAYRDLANAHRWTYLLTHGRVATVAPYLAGTVAYDHAGGDPDRRVVLSGGTWPAWASSGAYLRVGFQGWKVAARVSDAVLRLDTLVNPGADVDYDPEAVVDMTAAAPIVVTSPGHGLTAGDEVVIEGGEGLPEADGTWTATAIDADTFSLDDSDGSASGPYNAGTATWRHLPTTSYTLFQDGYLLPEDFVSTDQALYEQNFGGMEYVHPREWLFQERFVFAQGTPRTYTVMGDPAAPGRLVLRVAPFPTEGRTIDFIYHRRPRALRVAQETTGRVATQAASTVVAGTGTAFTQAMVGSVLRVSAVANRAPTGPVGGLAGNNPAAFESVILQVASADALVVADACPDTLVGVPYVVSDPIDVEAGAMLNAFWRCCEKHIGMNRTLKDKPSARLQYDEALMTARAADSRSFMGRVAGDARPYRQRLRDMPLNLTNEG